MGLFSLLLATYLECDLHIKQLSNSLYTLKILVCTQCIVVLKLWMVTLRSANLESINLKTRNTASILDFEAGQVSSKKLIENINIVHPIALRLLRHMNEVIINEFALVSKFYDGNLS